MHNTWVGMYKMIYSSINYNKMNGKINRNALGDNFLMSNLEEPRESIQKSFFKQKQV